MVPALVSINVSMSQTAPGAFSFNFFIFVFTLAKANLLLSVEGLLTDCCTFKYCYIVGFFNPPKQNLSVEKCYTVEWNYYSLLL